METETEGPVMEKRDPAFFLGGYRINFGGRRRWQIQEKRLLNTEVGEPWQMYIVLGK